MIRKCPAIVIFLLLILVADTALAQLNQTEIKLKFRNSSYSKIESGSSLTLFKTIALLFPLNPIFQLEGKRFYAGLTKEFSIGKFPFGRLAAEYSVIFRSTHLNQLRFSYNFDIPVEPGDFASFLFSVGGGYFTDFNKTGYFPQASFGLLIPADDNIGVNGYFKLRNTFMIHENESDIFDITFGLATLFYF